MAQIQEAGEKVLANVERVIIGKHHEVRLALVAHPASASCAPSRL